MSQSNQNNMSTPIRKILQNDNMRNISKNIENDIENNKKRMNIRMNENPNMFRNGKGVPMRSRVQFTEKDSKMFSQGNGRQNHSFQDQQGTKFPFGERGDKMPPKTQLRENHPDNMGKRPPYFQMPPYGIEQNQGKSRDPRSIFGRDPRTSLGVGSDFSKGVEGFSGKSNMKIIKETVLVVVLFIVLASPQINNIISKYLPIKNKNPYIILLLKALLVGALYFFSKKFV